MLKSIIISEKGREFMKNIFVKKTVKFIVSLVLILSMLSATACGDSNSTSTKAPELTPTGTPEVTMQDILNSIGNI